ncbi:MAG: hypothetical protein PHX34_00075 [Candidatus Shapirobacteria bacterium]|nr:hypothetical protein [Candidatus Shapirobacteria bacterium]
MSLSIKEVSLNEYTDTAHLFKNIPLWADPKIISCYKNKLILVVNEGTEIRGVWVIPFIQNNGIKIAKRNFRFLPYSSPYILEKDNLKRREIVDVFIKYATQVFNSIYLPFDMDFFDFSPIQARGALVEWRHNHVLTEVIDLKRINSRLRNHIRSSQKSVKILIDDNLDNFNFDIAIKGSDEEKEQRKQLAIDLINQNKAIIISAKNKQKICAGVLMSFDDRTSYLMHSWQLQNTPRGTISNLIFEASKWTFEEKHLKYFDFEGSVIQKIDYFFDGFNAKITPYGFVHWSTDEKNLYNLINKSINIDGRLI